MDNELMNKWIDISWTSFAGIIISAIGIYFAVILFTRIGGKRSFSKMSSFDFAMTIAIGSIMASSILSSSVSLTEGIIGLAIVFILQTSAAFLRRYKSFRNAIDNTPLILMDGKNMLEENMRKARVTEGDLRAKLREANVINLNQVKLVVFETTGDISVLHSDKEDIEVEDWLLEGVDR